MRGILLSAISVLLLSTGGLAQTSGSPNGLVVFETFGIGVGTDATQASVLPGVMTTHTVLFAIADARLSHNLGLAVVNPGSTAAKVTLALRHGSNGSTSSVRVVTVGAHQQFSRFISELFADEPGLPLDTDGSLEITSDTPIAIVALRFREAVFSTIPIISFAGSAPLPLIAPGVGGGDAVILPQFAAGGGWSSEIIISNTTAKPVSVHVDLFKGDGTPLTTSLNGQSGSSFPNLVIPAEGILILDNEDSGPLQRGYAIVTPHDSSAPTVTSTAPENMDFSAQINNNQKVIATFSKSMNPSTINTQTFTLKQGFASIPGTVTYAGTTAFFTPINRLTPSTAYSGTITTGAKDVLGYPLSSDFTWTFTTAGTADLTPPMVSFTVPAHEASGVQYNHTVSATFSKWMDPLTITDRFALRQVTSVAGAASYNGKNAALTPSGNVEGTVGFVGRTATFTPSGNLAANARYTATIAKGVGDLSSNVMTSDHVWSFTTSGALDTTAPKVTLTNPAHNATDVALNKKIAATFDEAMDPLTISTETFALKQGITPIKGTVTYAGLTATFSPLSNLAGGNTYTATITSGVKDLAGNALASSLVWSFTIGAAADTTPPTVISTDPGIGAASAAINKKISVTFSEAMDPLRITSSTFTLAKGATNVPGTVTCVGMTATFSPTSNLESRTTYTATITTDARDLAGNPLAGYFAWNFTTGAAPDTTAPTVSSTDPANGATGVALNKELSATFSEAMDPLTITTANFSVTGPGVTPVAGTVVFDEANKIAVFTPAVQLPSGTTFTATITTAARDLAGNALAGKVVWTFSTAASSGAATVPSEAAARYGIPADAGMTNGGPTIINGSLVTIPNP